MNKSKVAECPICCNIKTRKIGKTKKIGVKTEVFLCKNCRIFFCPCIDAKRIANYYSSKEGLPFRYSDGLYKRTASDQYQWLSKNVSLEKIKSIFEVGCGKGYLLEYFRKNNPKLLIKGLEPDYTAAEYGKDKLNFDIDPGIFETYENECKYDLIVLSHVIEHVLDPISFLNRLRNDFLTPQGIIFCEVPSGITEMPAIHLNDNTTKYFFNLTSPEHICVYNPVALKKLFTQVGFSVIKMEDCSSFYIRNFSKHITQICKAGIILQMMPDDEKQVIKKSSLTVYYSLLNWINSKLFWNLNLSKNSGLRILCSK